MCEEGLEVVRKHRKCWKVGSRWGNQGESIAPIFYAEGMLFVGNGDGHADGFMEICEGDLILVAHGFRVVAVAEALTPAAKVERFAWHSPSTSVAIATTFGSEDAFLGEGEILAVRAKIHRLAEEDCWDYAKQARFHAVQSTEQIDRAEQAWSRYEVDEAKYRFGFFDLAINERSQDAFLCWLLVQANALEETPEKRAAWALLRELAGEDFAEGAVTVYAQWNHIDVLVCFNELGKPEEQRFLVIEDKVEAALYNNLASYRDAVIREYSTEKWTIKPEQVRCAVVKTGDDCALWQRSREATDGSPDRPRVVLRETLLRLLKQPSAASGLLEDFVKHWEAVEAENKAYLAKPYDAWSGSWCTWKGFYRALLEEGTSGFGEWSYVSNPSQSFLALIGAVWTPVCEDYSLYAQIDNTREELHLKLGAVPDTVDRSGLMWRVVNAIERVRREGALPEVLNALCKPNRRRTGTYMTLFVLPVGEWLRLEPGEQPDEKKRVDVTQTALRLGEINDAIRALAETIRPRLTC